MKLIYLIRNLRKIDSAKEISAQQLPGVEFDQIDLYLVNEISAESEVEFFDAEEIPNKLEMEVNGVKYINLFPLYLTQEIVESLAKSGDPGVDDSEIVRRLIEY